MPSIETSICHWLIASSTRFLCLSLSFIRLESEDQRSRLLSFQILGCMADQSQESSDKNVEIWKIKKLIKSLEAARGNGTSMISLIIPPRDQIPRIAKMLADEYGTASNIKSRVNRLSVLSAITSVQARLKLYNKVPNNGLVIYCGTIVTDDGKEKKVNIDFEPFKPINTSLYLCDNKFHTEVRFSPLLSIRKLYRVFRLCKRCWPMIPGSVSSSWTGMERCSARYKATREK